MTMMLRTEEDALFELELRVLPAHGKDEYSVNAGYTDDTHTAFPSEGCTTTSNCSVTCYTRFAPEGAGTLAPTMCNT